MVYQNEDDLKVILHAMYEDQRAVEKLITGWKKLLTLQFSDSGTVEVGISETYWHLGKVLAEIAITIKDLKAILALK